MALRGVSRSGQVLLGDTDLTSAGDKDLTALRRTRIGFVFQSFNPIGALTAEQNVALPLRLAIARAMVTRPDVLFADEPTGALDSGAARIVLDLMRAMADAGQNIVMVTHDPGAAARADAVVFLRDGRVVDRLAGADARQVADRLAAWER